MRGRFEGAGDIYVNDIDYSTLDDSIHRSLFLWRSGTNDVEAGWTANNPNNDPVIYFEEVVNGIDSGVQTSSYHPQKDGYPNIKLIDNHGDGVFHAWFNGNQFDDSSSFSFDKAQALTNSERRDADDTLWAHFDNLDVCPNVNNQNNCTGWNGSYQHLDCWASDSTQYKLVKDSNHSVHVQQSGTDLC